MAGRREFMAQFDPQFREGVSSFAGRITNTDADVVIAMARKATCFVDALATLKLLRSQVPVYSDRILDMELSAFRGRRILLVDDVVISGTTLYEATETLRAAGAEVVCEAVGVDQQSWSPDLVLPQEPYLSLTNQASMALCGEIVSAISLIPRPYNVDWPLTTIRLPNQVRERVHKVSGFAAADVTTSLQARYGIAAFTCAPERWVQDSVDSSFGWPTGRFAQLVKVRLYVAPLPAGSEFTVRVMPLFSFASLRFDELDQLWNSALAHLPDMAEPFGSAFVSPTSRLRLLQFLISARYGAAWTDRLQRGVDSTVEWVPEKAQADYIFTPDVSGLACRAAGYSHQRLFEDVPVFSSEAPQPPRSHQARLGVTPTASLQQQLTRPFTELFEQKERRARHLAKRYGPAALDRSAYRRLMGRLKEGYSMSQLVDLLRRGGGARLSEEEAGRFVSLWLDLALDAGIAVPITAEVDDTLVRAFRHGEDVHFGDAEEHLCWVVLEAAARAWGRTELPRVVTEKILVLFIRYGVIKSTLRRWEDGRLGDPDTVGVRFALHGAVVRSGSREMFGDEQGCALTERLVSSGRLSLGPKRGRRRRQWVLGPARESDHLPLTSSQIRDARLLGLLVGGRLSMPRQDGFTSSDLLTLLATCGPEADLPSALAAEVAIVESRINDIVSRYSNTRVSHLANLRAMGDNAANTAANSGHWKFSNGYESIARQRWLDLLSMPTGNEVNDESWAQVVESITKAETELRDSDVNKLIKSMGAWLSLAALTFRVLRLLDLVSLTEEQRKRFDDKPDTVLLRCLELASEARTAHASLADNPLLAEVESSLGGVGQSIRTKAVAAVAEQREPLGQIDAATKQRLHQAAIRELRSLRPLAHPLVDEAHARAGRHGGLRRVTTYNGALRVELADADDAANPEFAAAIHDAIDRHRRNSRGVIIDTLPSPRQTRGWTVVCSHREAWRYLARIAATLVNQCGKVPGLRIAILGDLPRDEHLYVGFDSTEPYGNGFYRRIGAVSQALSKAPPRQVHVVSLDAVDENRASRALDAVIEMAGPPAAALKRTVEAPEARSKLLPIGTWAAAHARGVLEVAESHPVDRVDIGIITVLIEEANAVTDLLKRHGRYEKRGTGAGRTFHAGELPAGEGRWLKVMATRCLDPDETSAAVAYADLVSHCRPKMILVVGIAGSIHRDVSLGDVVLASQVIRYDMRKETPDGTRRRGRADPAPAVIRRCIGDFLESLGPEPSLLGRNGHFTVHAGPIGTGSAVIGHELSDIRQWLSSYNDKTAAVETEAGGIVTPFYERAASDGVTGFCIVRGISDRADRNKDDDWHRKASENAASAAEALAPFFTGILQ